MLNIVSTVEVNGCPAVNKEKGSEDLPYLQNTDGILQGLQVTRDRVMEGR